MLDSKTTKLQVILRTRGLTQTDLYNIIKDSHHKNIGHDRINKLVNGKQPNYTIETAKTIADVLDLTINDVVD